MSQQVQVAKRQNTRLARGLLWIVAAMNMVLLLLMCANASHGALLPLALLAVLVDFGVVSFAASQGLVFELKVEHTWKKVCSGLGGSFVGQGRLQFQTRVALDPISSLTKGKWERKTIYPKIRDVRGDWTSWTGIIHPLHGQCMDDYAQKADHFALSFHVPAVSFELSERGSIRIRAGKVIVPPEYEYQAIAQPASHPQLTPRQVAVSKVPNVWAKELQLLEAVPMAVGLDGRWWHMPIKDTHVLVAARTNGGKGSIIWSLVLRLEPAWKVGLVKFWGCDPKRLELSIGRNWWEHYADTDESIVELLELAVKEMFERGSQLQGVARKFTPSRKTPLNVIVIDELGYLSSLLTDRKLQMRADLAIKTLLTQGRSNGYAVVGCVQDPWKSTVEYRDLFPIRIAGGLNEAKMVDLVLGEGMHDAGAVCEQIPMGRAGAGVAYVLDAEHSMKPRLVRAAWCSDIKIRNTLTPLVRFQAEAFETGS
jgi:hypothetical protein